MAPTEELSKEPMEKAKQRLLHTVVKGKKKSPFPRSSFKCISEEGGQRQDI